MRIYVAIPAVPSEAKVVGFEGQIEVDSCSIEATRSYDSSGTFGPARPGDLQVIKSVDKTSMLLGDAFAKTTRLGTIVVTFLQETSPNAGKKPLVMHFTDALVRLIEDAGAAGGAAAATEKIAFTFASAKFVYASPTGAVESTLTR